jgi:hypothetical protein
MPQLSPIPLRHLLVLVALVLCAHGLLLSGRSSAWNPAKRPGGALSLRSIAPAPLPTALNALPASPVAVAPAAPLATPPRLKQRPLAAKKKSLDRPAAQWSEAQAAPENIANAAPQTAPPALPPAPQTVPVLAPPPSPSVAEVTATAEATAPSSAGADPAVGLQFPPSGSFAYAATVLRGVQPQTGSGTLEWSSDGRVYHMRLVSTALFITVLSQTSVGQLGADGLQPERFSDKRFNRSEKAAHFNRSAQEAGPLGRITFSGNQSAVAIQRGGQDRLSVLVQLAGLVAASPARFAAAGKVAVQVASTEGADLWQFVLDGAERLELPAGMTQTLRLVRNPRQEYDARLELWLAPELGYLPVRMRQTEANGDTTDLQLRSPALRNATPP